MTELRYTSKVTPTVFCASLNATQYLENPFFQSRMKHLAIDFHYVLEKVQQGTLNVTQIFDDGELADDFTKPL